MSSPRFRLAGRVSTRDLAAIGLGLTVGVAGTLLLDWITGPQTVEDCILENLDKASTSNGESMIGFACEDKFNGT